MLTPEKEKMEQDISSIYNALNPSDPLPPGASTYVDCSHVRGDRNILRVLGRAIQLEAKSSTRLYTGHRGAGKSTELLRLKENLEEKGVFTVYFEADAEDINSEDVQYSDILLACTRQLLKTLRSANSQPIRSWIQDRWEDLADLANTKLSIDKLDLEGQIVFLSKLTASIRAEPSQRAKIREKIAPHTPSLLEALNDFISDAKKRLPEGKTRLAVIVDNLDRIGLVPKENGRSNHEEIFLDHCEQLKGLDCDLIYTVPIALVYSQWATDLQAIFGHTQILPMVMVSTPDDNIHPPGLSKLREAIDLRVESVCPFLDLETEVFESAATLESLCKMSGGHLRELLQLAQYAINYTDTLPITEQAARRAIADIRQVFERTVEEHEWSILAEVARTKRIQNDNRHRSLLQRRCILEYCQLDPQGIPQTWYDAHPQIKEILKSRGDLDNF